MALSPGTKLGPYEIVAPIGAGGMGEVYRGKDTRLDRSVAVKILPAQFSAAPVRKQRFEREANRFYRQHRRPAIQFELYRNQVGHRRVERGHEL